MSSEGSSSAGPSHRDDGFVQNLFALLMLGDPSLGIPPAEKMNPLVARKPVPTPEVFSLAEEAGISLAAEEGITFDLQHVEAMIAPLVNPKESLETVSAEIMGSITRWTPPGEKVYVQLLASHLPDQGSGQGDSTSSHLAPLDEALSFLTSDEEKEFDEYREVELAAVFLEALFHDAREASCVEFAKAVAKVGDSVLHRLDSLEREDPGKWERRPFVRRNYFSFTGQRTVLLEEGVTEETQEEIMEECEEMKRWARQATREEFHEAWKEYARHFVRWKETAWQQEKKESRGAN